MMRHLIVFEWTFYIRKISFYVMLLGFLAFGLLVGTSAGIGFPNITYNSPYAINFIFGLFSLASLFPMVLMASQSLMREQDHRFEQILYTTSITNRDYFGSRFSVVFGISILSFAVHGGIHDGPSDENGRQCTMGHFPHPLLCPIFIGHRFAEYFAVYGVGLLCGVV
ncbi:MAG: hypothetical protein IPL23_27555 [Saprospiraceae bacterium]|nr:hypothetical protein [Saprospiraceae bacterium]